MCKISGKLKFCSCDIDDIYEKEHYWIFYRYEKDQLLPIMGSILPTMNILITTARYNNKSLLRLINDPSSFDIDLKPKAKDRLQLHFTIDSVHFLDYGFEYKDNKWVSKKYHPFEWEEKHYESKHGKIVKALDTKTKSHTKKYGDLELTTSTQSVLDENEKRLMELINYETPKTKEEKELLQQIKEIEKKGRIIDIPSSGF